MKLMVEECFDVEHLVEGTGDSKSHYISGPFLAAEVANRNGRRYPRSILEREVNNYQKLISERRSVSELGHPETPNINLDRVSHLITQLKFNGNIVEGKAKIIDTPMGKIAKSLLDEGVKLGVSSRGIGSLKMEEGVNVVQEDYKMCAIDIVSDPSGPGCFVQGLMEQKDWIYSNGAIVEADINAIYEQVKSAHRRDLEIATLKAFQVFVSRL